MARQWCIGLLQAVTTLMLAHAVAPVKRNGLPTDPLKFIRKLYNEVTWYHPLGVLDYEYVGQQKPKLVNGDEARSRFTPYLSQALRHRIAVYDTCLADLSRQHVGEAWKLPAFEGGIFSGGNEYGGVRRFQIDKIQNQPDGSERAFLTLSAPIEPPKWTNWRVEVILIGEKTNLRVDDVIYRGNEESSIHDETLSGILSSACSHK